MDKQAGQRHTAKRSPRIPREEAVAEVSGVAAPLALSDLRSRVDRTQAQIAAAIRTSQSGVSRIERQRDILISTLRDYVEATGGQLHVVAKYTDDEYEIRIPVLHDVSRAADL